MQIFAPFFAFRHINIAILGLFVNSGKVTKKYIYTMYIYSISKKPPKTAFYPMAVLWVSYGYPVVRGGNREGYGSKRGEKGKTKGRKRGVTYSPIPPIQRCSQLKNVRCQRIPFWGLSTQWFSSGKINSSAGTPRIFAAS